MLLVGREFGLEACFRNHAFNLRHQVAALKHLSQRGSFFAQHAFLSGKRFQQHIEQVRIAAEPPRGALAVALQIDQLLQASFANSLPSMSWLAPTDFTVISAVAIRIR